MSDANDVPMWVTRVATEIDGVVNSVEDGRYIDHISQLIYAAYLAHAPTRQPDAVALGRNW